jgi:hypothetical protein
MASTYISLPVITDSDVIAQQAIANISQNLPGWVAREGNLEVLILEQMALAAAEAATTASDVPNEIFTFYGSLIGITPMLGTYETIQVTLTLVSPAAGSPGYQIPAGTQMGFYFAGASYVFETMTDSLITTGGSSISLTVRAVAVGSVYDLDTLSSTSGLNLTSLYLQLSNSDPLVSIIELTSTPATNANLILGTDPESSTSFLNRLSAELQLLAPRPITSSDYSLFSQNVAGIYRALSIDGINPFSNLMSVTNANPTLMATSGSIPSGWVGVGDGGTNLAALSTPGTSPSNYVAVTTAASALTSLAPFEAASIVGATSITITTGTGPAISTSASPTNPAVVIIIDTVNGNEVSLVTAAAATTGSGATTQQVLTLGAPLGYAHSTSATLSVAQGADLPLVGSTPGSPGITAANSKYYQASAVIQCGSDTTATAKPHIVALATYLDGSTRVFSSHPQFTSGLFDYTASPKTILCNIPTVNSSSSNYLAGSANAPYNTLKPSLVSVKTFVVWTVAGTSKTHYIYYDSVAATPQQFQDDDQPTISTSYWNFIPDPNLSSYYFANSALGSWSVPSGVTVIPGFGFQYLGTGSALGSNLTVTSQIFNLSNVSSDNPGVTTRNYTAFATVDASYTGSNFGNINVEVWDLSTGAILTTGSGPTNVSVSPASPILSTLTIPFTLTTAKDVEVRIVFGTGLNVPLNSSVVISNIGIMGGTQTAAYCTSKNDGGYSWTQGGLYSTQVFNYPRMISICPIDVNGIGVIDSVNDNLISYLQSRREINFVTNVLQPNYLPIDISWSAYVEAGYSAATVQTAVNAAIRNFLNPATWANGQGNPPSWDGSQTTIRIFDIASAMSQVQGLGSITAVTTRPSWPISGSYGTSDIVMIGIAGLPIANNITSSILTSTLAAFSGLT